MTNQTYSDLLKGVTAGYGSSFSTFGKDAGKDAAVIQMRQNLYRFSHAKTLTELEEFNKALYDGDQIKSLPEFKKEVEKINAKYNRSYLETEYNTARNAAEHARKWNEYQEDKKLFPNLKYMTVSDERVRDEHAVLHGVIKPLDDPFWSLYYPPNGWNCRCYTVQTAEQPDTGKFEDKSIKKEFLGNVGTDNIIFSKDHTFFQIAKEVGTAKTEEAFEYSKISTPYIKAYKDKITGATVEVSPWTDKTGLFANYRTAIKLAKNGTSVMLNPNLDSNIIPGKNAEYFINENISDLKSDFKENNYKGVNNAFTAAREQGTKSIVFDFTYKFKTLDVTEVNRWVLSNINEKRGKSFKEIIFLYGNKSVAVSRETIVKKQLFVELQKLKASS